MEGQVVNFKVYTPLNFMWFDRKVPCNLPLLIQFVVVVHSTKSNK